MSWQYLLAAREIVSQSATVGTSIGYDPDIGKIVRTDLPDSASCLWLDDIGGWCRKTDLPSICHTLFDLYLPALGNNTHTNRITAHLGQSIDARIATSGGDSFYVTGEENRKHLHCLRALNDAVIVGSATVLADDPQLTTRAVPGLNPVRVVLDPHARLKAPLQIFSDGQARTVLLHRSSAEIAGHEMCFGPHIADRAGRSCHQVERVIVPDSDENLSVNQIITSLNKLGLYRLFVEGGGITVSRFLQERSLDRLHVAVAPVLVGEGIDALKIKGVGKMMLAHRPPHAIYRMGDDVLWDFDTSAMKDGSAGKNMIDRNTGVERKQHSLQSLERIA